MSLTQIKLLVQYYFIICILLLSIRRNHTLGSLICVKDVALKILRGRKYIRVTGEYIMTNSFLGELSVCESLSKVSYVIYSHTF